jgi:hypothetical protein
LPFNVSLRFIRFFGCGCRVRVRFSTKGWRELPIRNSDDVLIIIFCLPVFIFDQLTAIRPWRLLSKIVRFLFYPSLRNNQLLVLGAVGIARRGIKHRRESIRKVLR